MIARFPYLEFMSLHRMLCIKMLKLDLILGVFGALFLVLPIGIVTLSLNNLVVLILGMLASLLYLIHIYRTYSGNASYYLSLPINTLDLMPFYLVNSFSPLIVSIVLYIIVKVIFSCIGISLSSVGMGLVERGYYLFLILSVVKIIPLPLFILYKKHLALIPLSLILLAMLYAILSLVIEVVSGFMQIPAFVIGILFIGSIIVICIRILTTAKIN